MPPRPKITDVFTPRSATVNSEMYVERPKHERALGRSVDGALHTVLTGESGSGKSWMYKRVAEEKNWLLFTGNLSNAARKGSVTAEIVDVMTKDGTRTLVSQADEKHAGINIMVAKGEGTSTRAYDVKQPDALLEAFRRARKAGKKRSVVLALDNLEAIFDDQHRMDELGNIILLLDDERYAQERVSILLVGVPSHMIEYFQTINNLQPVANRLEEVPPVVSLGRSGVKDFVKKGFFYLLQVPLTDGELRQWSNHIYDVTLGIAQRVQEYCLRLGYVLEDRGWQMSASVLDLADREFLNSALVQAYSTVEGCMNEKETKVGRRNQVLFALGKIRNLTFDVSDVENAVRTTFPKSTRDVRLGVSQILSDLASSERGLLRKSAKGSEYRFSDSRCLMCLRIMLRVDASDETVSKRYIKR